MVSGSALDLIDTLWNVKFYCYRDCNAFEKDLIDTLWNVKIRQLQQMKICSSRFNRYIVECKGERDGRLEPSRCDLIDTLWNVKDSFSSTQALLCWI